MALTILSHAEQVAAHLREELLRGRWAGQMPGVLSLEKELEVNRTTIDLALKHLEKEGVLVAQGVGRRRRIELKTKEIPLTFRLGILNHGKDDHRVDYLVDLQHRLREAGYAVSFAKKSQTELGMSLKKMSRLVEDSGMDAWIVVAGSRDLLSWFLDQQIPVFALFGRMRGLSLAGLGTEKGPALQSAVQQLLGLGHQRMAMLVREEKRKPKPGHLEQTFLDELENAGITPGRYHLPDWDPSPGGFQRMLDELFRITPPTALIIDEAPFVIAALQYLGRRSVAVPQDVSLIALDPDPVFSYCDPEITHIRWKSHPIAIRISRWAANIAQGIPDHQKTFIKAKLIEGGTVDEPV